MCVHYAGLMRGRRRTETSTYGLQRPLDQTRSISAHFCPTAVRDVQNADWLRDSSEVFFKEVGTTEEET